jgi:type IV secretion system protein VirB7
MITKFPLLCMAVALTGCASLADPLPKCDGYSRRPLNRSMWQWEDNSNLTHKQSDARPAASQYLETAFVEEGRRNPASAQFDVDASYRPRPCAG